MILRPQGGPPNHWISFELAGSQEQSARPQRAPPATAGDLSQLDEVRSGGSYLSQSDLRIHFGLAGHEELDKLEIFWPSGKVETLANLAADHSYLR